MNENLPNCPQCNCEYTYELGALLVCPECAHEWSAVEAENSDEVRVVKDSAGNVLVDGDTVTITKDLKVKGSSTSVKVGTKVKNIRLISPVDGHDIDAKVDGFGSMYLKSSIVKKVL
jgi:protein PhnA